ncbi:hypothetical protein CU103_08285 [Phyllobacterium sophorae]|uniref:Uncharacterized protein n=1 Tax=Phyllobacterium sophorae TaxID=1520277 RepID=A0A2P7BEY6_9HYPH|nr:hypothetical protein CU103_08285 [Phyllobacterium sophorae]
MPIFCFVFMTMLFLKTWKEFNLRIANAPGRSQASSQGILVDGILDGLDPPLGWFAYIISRASWSEPYCLPIF